MGGVYALWNRHFPVLIEPTQGFQNPHFIPGRSQSPGVFPCVDRLAELTVFLVPAEASQGGTAMSGGDFCFAAGQSVPLYFPFCPV